MTERRVALLAMRVFGLYVAFSGLSGLLHLVEVVSFSGININLLTGLGVLSSTLTLLLGIGILLRAEQLASYALGAEVEGQPIGLHAQPTPSSSLTATTILTIAILIIGIYLLSRAIVHGLEAVGWAFYDPAPPESSAGGVVSFQSGVPVIARTEAYKAVAHLLAGLPLTLGSRRIANVFARHVDGRSTSVVEDLPSQDESK